MYSRVIEKDAWVAHEQRTLGFSTHNARTLRAVLPVASIFAMGIEKQMCRVFLALVARLSERPTIWLAILYSVEVIETT